MNPQIRYAMLVDCGRCTGCHTCSVACKAENNVPLGCWRSWVKQVEKGAFPRVRRRNIPLLCNNCEEPICATVCPVKATYQREDGVVLVDQHRCIGCRYCMAACPYDVRYLNPLTGTVQKCTWCHHRLEAGLVPACVDVCPTSARRFGDLTDPKGLLAGALSSAPTQRLRPEMGTGPMVFYIDLDPHAALHRQRTSP